MDPTTIPAENWADLLGAVIIGPIVHGLITILGNFSFMQNENLTKGLGIGLCFGFMYLFSQWFDPTMTPKMLLIAALAAWGAASTTKLAQSVGTKIVAPKGP